MEYILLPYLWVLSCLNKVNHAVWKLNSIRRIYSSNILTFKLSFFIHSFVHSAIGNWFHRCFISNALKFNFSKTCRSHKLAFLIPIPYTILNQYIQLAKQMWKNIFISVLFINKERDDYMFHTSGNSRKRFSICIHLSPKFQSVPQ